jgi:gluconokinase
MSKIIIVMGVSASGKTTLASALAARFNYPFLEGDLFHSKTNKEKMTNGVPLDDNDRLPWLKEINKTLRRFKGKPVVLSCSALKEKYRKLLSYKIEDNFIFWIYLHCDFTVLKKRMKERTHFMPVSLLQSQLETLEAPTNALTLNCTLSVEEMIEQLKPYLNES